MTSGSPAPPARAPLLHAVGPVIEAVVESSPQPERVDHVWITIEPMRGQRLVLAINTLSQKNRGAGFDDRIWVGRVWGHWEILPQATIEPWAEFAYAAIESQANVFYETLGRLAMEELLLELAESCLLLEAWGTPYHRQRGKISGLHQIHSRAPSCAVREGLVGRDGALRFYFAQDQKTLLLLCKFCGQT